MFKPGAVIHDGSSFKLISDPLTDPKQLFVSLFSSLSSFKDKLRVLSLIFDLSNYDIQKDRSEDMTTIDFLKKRKFSEKFIELFFNPFFEANSPDKFKPNKTEIAISNPYHLNEKGPS